MKIGETDIRKTTGVEDLSHGLGLVGLKARAFQWRGVYRGNASAGALYFFTVASHDESICHNK